MLTVTNLSSVGARPQTDGPTYNNALVIWDVDADAATTVTDQNGASAYTLSPTGSMSFTDDSESGYLTGTGKLALASNTALTESMNQDGAVWTIGLILRTPASFTTNHLLFATGDGGGGATDDKVVALFNSSGNIFLQIAKDGLGEVSVTTDTAFSADTNYFVLISISDPAGVGFIQVNGAAAQVSASDTFAVTLTGSDAPPAVFTVVNRPANDLPFGGRFIGGLLWDSAQSEAEGAAIYAEVKAARPTLSLP